MGVILLPNGLPGKKAVEHLTAEEVKMVTTFEEWCRRRGIILDLICRKCLDEGRGKASRIYGENDRNALTYHVTCAHCDRIYGEAAPR